MCLSAVWSRPQGVSLQLETGLQNVARVKQCSRTVGLRDTEPFCRAEGAAQGLACVCMLVGLSWGGSSLPFCFPHQPIPHLIPSGQHILLTGGFLLHCYSKGQQTATKHDLFTVSVCSQASHGRCQGCLATNPTINMSFFTSHNPPWWSARWLCVTIWNFNGRW